MLRNIFITGASSGIGRALSEFYADRHVTLGLLSRDESKLNAVAIECRQKGSRVYTYVADVTKPDIMRKCAFDFQNKVDSVDIVVANAGIRLEEDHDFSNVSIPASVMEVNYIGLINTFTPFIASMKDKHAGVLVAISSIAAFRGTPNSGAYSASKAAVNLWTESLRLRLHPYGISVCTLCLGFVKTAMTDGLVFNMPGLISAEKAAKLIAKSIKNRKRTAMFPWQSKWIWTVFRILPGSLYDKLILWAASRHIKKPV